MTTKKLAQIIGTRIRSARIQRGMTAEKLAYENGWSKGYISNIENGKRLPSLEFLLAVATVLKVEIWTLLKEGSGFRNVSNGTRSRRKSTSY